MLQRKDGRRQGRPGNEAARCAVRGSAAGARDDGHQGHLPRQILRQGVCADGLHDDHLRVGDAARGAVCAPHRACWQGRHCVVGGSSRPDRGDLRDGDLPLLFGVQVPGVRHWREQVPRDHGQRRRQHVFRLTHVGDQPQLGRRRLRAEHGGAGELDRVPAAARRAPGPARGAPRPHGAPGLHDVLARRLGCQAHGLHRQVQRQRRPDDTGEQEPRQVCLDHGDRHGRLLGLPVRGHRGD
mmetsp:Transcript_4235/g.10195  ORF Transcript_4235/g.10195 Transcript_4235/m.10195 type:complete len:240 (-) Transcript_4235:1304-2023(-)